MFRGMMQRVDRLLGRGVIDEALYEDLEEALLQADTPISVTGEILAFTVELPDDLQEILARCH